jgi:hypothetical protein
MAIPLLSNSHPNRTIATPHLRVSLCMSSPLWRAQFDTLLFTTSYYVRRCMPSGGWTTLAYCGGVNTRGKRKGPQTKCNPGCGPTLREGGLTSNAILICIRLLEASDIQDAATSERVRNDDWFECIRNLRPNVDRRQSAQSRRASARMDRDPKKSKRAQRRQQSSFVQSSNTSARPIYKLRPPPKVRTERILQNSRLNRN